MKKFALLLFVIGTAGFVLDYYVDYRSDDDTYLEQLEHTLACADWKIHVDETYGYEVRYPSCFVQHRIEEEGACSFGYYEQRVTEDIPYITMEAHTEMLVDSTNPKREIYKLSQKIGAIALQKGERDFVMTGRMESKNRYVTSWRFTAHYTLRQRMWFVLVLYYPEDFGAAVGRLTEEVDRWRPWG